MSHDHVTAVLPRLRRHAFVLAGDMVKADEAVFRCLTAYRADPARVRRATAELDMFRLLHDVTSLPAPDADPRPRLSAVSNDAKGRLPRALDARLLRHLGQLRPLERRVLALSAVEGFTPQECSHILSLAEDTVKAALAQARRQFAALDDDRTAPHKAAPHLACPAA